MWVFLLGFLLGVISVFVVGYFVLFNVFGEKVPPAPFIDQFQPLRIPAELKVFLRSHSEGNFTWESCLSLSLLFHFLFQEHKDTRKFRRWVYKKLQLELNDVTTKYAASRIITGVQIRELSLGTESPVIKNIRVEKFVMSEGHELFDEISFEVDVDYRGGFETSIDLNMILGRSAHLSIKVMKLAGKARIVMSRRPFAHWYFAFIEMPQLDFKIDSKFQGHQLKKVIPLITTAFRKAFQRKHVWPNYKIRYRPILPHPFLQPAPPISSFDHININGTGLEVTVLQCTRLNTKIFRPDHTDVYCTVTLDQRPFLTNARLDSTHCISVMLTFTRKGASDSVGLSFVKNDANFKAVKVSDVEVDSTAEKCGFKRGDVLLAINSVPIRNEKQAMRLLSGTAGDLLVLVERDLNYYFEDEIDDGNVDAFSEEFICISKKGDKDVKARRGSNASNPSIADSFTQTNEEVSWRKTSFESKKEGNAEVKFDGRVQSEENGRFLRAKSTHIPKLSLQRPSTDIVRSRSESDLFGDLASELGSNSCGRVKAFASTILNEENESELTNEERSLNEFSDALSRVPSNGELNETQKAEDQSPGEDSLKTQDNLRCGSPKPSSKRERIQARASEMALKINAGRTKFNDLIWNRAKNKDEMPSPTSSIRSSILFGGSTVSNNEGAECALEADAHDFSSTGNNDVRESKGRVGSPSLELRVMDKSKKRWIGRKRKSPSPSVHRGEQTAKSPNSLNDSNSANVENSDLVGDANEYPTPPLINSRQTKSVPLTKNPLWGQSLHFGLEQKTTKYLNITIHSRRKFGMAGSLSGQESFEDSTLLGYASVYIPQIVEDCQLTLSNSHREVFHLRPPCPENSEIPSEFAELGRRTGFDARLCYGDVTLGFRFFPQGLPDSTVRAATPVPDESPRHASNSSGTLNGRHEAVLEPADSNPLQTPVGLADDDMDDEELGDTRSAPESPKVYPHKWIQFHLRHGSYPCGICHGKIWLKWASRCSICNFICHNKCLEKANQHEQCMPSLHEFDDNTNFVVLDEKELTPSDNLSVAPSAGSDLSKDSSSMTRRRRIATTVSEKLSSTWKNVGAVAAASRRKTVSTASDNLPALTADVDPNANRLPDSLENSNTSSPITKSDPHHPNDKEWENSKTAENRPSEIITIDKIIDKEFLASLAGSENINHLKFEPGNAYNPQIIGDTKSTGQNVFDNISDLSKRKSRINEQIDMIQSEIDHINQTRRRLTSVTPSDDSGDPSTSLELSEATQRNRSSSSPPLNVNAAEIERLDIKREALALLMLHYCSGLSDCHEKEEKNEIEAENKSDLDGLVSSSLPNPTPTKTDDSENFVASSESLTLHGPERGI